MISFERVLATVKNQYPDKDDDEQRDIARDWCADLVKSIQSQSDLGDLELGATFSALPQFETKIAAGKPWPVTPQELERTGGLSGRAKTWLRNSSIMVYPSPLRHRNMAEIRLPDQKTFLIHLPTHPRNEQPSPEPNPPK